MLKIKICLLCQKRCCRWRRRSQVKGHRDKMTQSKEYIIYMLPNNATPTCSVYYKLNTERNTFCENYNIFHYRTLAAGRASRRCTRKRSEEAVTFRDVISFTFVIETETSAFNLVYKDKYYWTNTHFKMHPLITGFSATFDV